MDTFPNEIERMQCKKVLETSQEELIRETRQVFTNFIQNALKNCQKLVVLKFDDRMWDDGKKKITIELIERFGEILVESAANERATASININDPLKVPTRIIKLEITF